MLIVLGRSSKVQWVLFHLLRIGLLLHYKFSKKPFRACWWLEKVCTADDYMDVMAGMATLLGALLYAGATWAELWCFFFWLVRSFVFLSSREAKSFSNSFCFLPLFFQTISWKTDKNGPEMIMQFVFFSPCKWRTEIANPPRPVMSEGSGATTSGYF